MRYSFGHCIVDTTRYELLRAGHPVTLEPQAFRVLTYLLQHSGQAVRKQDLLQAFWSGPSEASYQEYSLRNCLHKIRQAIGDAGTSQTVIETLRGYGYRFTAAVTLCPPDPLVAGAALQHQEDTHAPPGPSASTRPLPGRRQLTVLSCALVADPIWTRLDPEDVQTVIQAFYRVSEQALQRFNGSIAQYDSEELLVYFGYPTADEAAAQQAVRAGLALVEAVQHLGLPRDHALGRSLAVRVGIHTGPVVVEEPMHPAAPALTGTTLILAKRVQVSAPPATVVLSAATYHLVQGYFTCQALDEHLSIGGDAPPGLYRVLGASGRHTRFEVAATRGLTPLVGREAELALLIERWAQVQDGMGHVIMLCGEPGIGKSRLVQALKDQVEGDTGTLIEWRGIPYYQHSALYPVITHLQRVLSWERDEVWEEKLHKLEVTLAQHPMGLATVVPLFAALLSLPLPERYPPLMLTPQRQRQRTLEALLAWLLATTARQAVLLIIEDMHWVDPSTLELLTLIIDQGPTARLYSLCTFRPEFTSPWHGRTHLTPLTLSRLSRLQVEHMVRNMTGGKALPGEVLAQIVAKTDGVPLFVEELTRTVLESGLLREDVEAYVLDGSLPPMVIPATLQDSLVARLDRLATTGAIAQLGATLGREFSYDLLQAVAPLTAEALQHGLHRLVEAEILYQRGTPPQATYVFKHALIQDAAYQSLLRSTRQQYHQRIAQALVERFPDTVATQPELVAQHYTEAGCTEQAIAYWQHAGQQALQRFANSEAVRHLNTGLGLLATLPETTARDQQELDLLTSLGPALMATQGYAAPEVEQTYARARVLCHQVGDAPQRFPVLYGLWAFDFVRGELRTARKLGEELLELAQRAQDPELLLEARLALGASLRRLGEVAAARVHLEHGIALYDPQQHRSHAFLYGQDPGVACLSDVAYTLHVLGYPDQALQRSHEAIRLARELAHPFSLAFALSFAAWLWQVRREAQATQTWAEAALTLATEQGFADWVGVGTVLRGWALAEQGQHAEGIMQMRQGLAAVLAAGTMQARPLCLLLLAEAVGHAGQVAEGQHLLAEALIVFEAGGQADLLAEVYRLQGVLLLRQTTPEATQAEACFHQALTIARHQQAKSWELRAAMSLARLWQQQGKWVAAYDVLTQVYGWFTEGFDTVDLQVAKALLEVLET